MQILALKLLKLLIYHIRLFCMRHPFVLHADNHQGITFVDGKLVSFPVPRVQFVCSHEKSQAAVPEVEW